MMLFTLETKLAIAAAALVTLSLAAAGCVRYGYTWGRDNVQDKWDAAKVEAQIAVAKALDTQQREAYTISLKYQNDIKSLETRNAKLATKSTEALRTKVVCPSSGYVGDVVLPAALVDSLFFHDPAASAPGPSTR